MSELHKDKDRVTIPAPRRVDVEVTWPDNILIFPTAPIECCACGKHARRQCADHDTGYGVCDACLKKYGRDLFCLVPSCNAHRKGGK